MTSDRAEELLYDSDRTRVARIRLTDGSFIVRKQPLGPDAADRLRNETAVLRHLDGLTGTPRLAGDGEGSLDLRDLPGRTLADLYAPWEPGALLELAGNLAGILAGIHRRGVVHRDLSPANVLVDADSGLPTLIDFELATLEAQTPDAPEAGFAGTLPYLSPEQTGRTGRPVDNRSDLYALGATLYELATGKPPFGRDREPLSLIHDHLAKVPVPPADLNPAIPALLSQMILRLLNKEPGQRYQSGEGLAHDLERLRSGADFTLGERDFPMRLAAPARLIGRSAPLAALHGLFAEVVAGRNVLALVTGPPGVGKTALVDRLRPALAAAGGRFVTGKFDQFHSDTGGGAVRQAFIQLGELLLAAPDDVVAATRERLLAALGADAAVVAGMMPSFAVLLGVEPDESAADDPRDHFARLRTASMTLLRTVVSADRPVVFFLDDLQWATGTAFSFLDDVLDRADLPGLLVLGAYREEAVDAAHPLSAVLARLHRERGDDAEVRLDNLSATDLGVLIAEMLRLPEAERLATVLAERTRGNPFDTVELLGALRREGVLVPEGGGWRWDAAAVRDFVGHGDVVALLGTRIAGLPADTRAAVDLLACLGGEVGLDLLGDALTPAVDDGLVVIEEDRARFRHDRVQQAAFERLSPDERARLSLALARRIAPAPAAAGLYLAAIDLLGFAEPGERRAAAGLLRRAAASARMVADHAMGEAHVAAALRLLTKTDEEYADTRAEWHASLFGLGRFDEADVVFAELYTPGRDPVWLAGPVGFQLGSLTHRRMLPEALALGLDMLGRLGVDVPGPAEIGARIGAGVSAFHSWLASVGDETALTEITDPVILAAALVINRMSPAAFFSDKTLMAWLGVQAGELWSGHGVSAHLAGSLGNIGAVTIAGGGDFAAAYRATSHVLAVAERFGFEPATSQVKFLHALAGVPWFEPLENAVRLAHDARDGLLRGGDLRNALYTYYTSVPQMLDVAADLEAFNREAQAASAFAERIGAGHDNAMFGTVGRFVRGMRGLEAFDNDEFFDGLAGNDAAAAFYAVVRALSAAIHGDDEDLVRFSRHALELLPATPGVYLLAPGHVLAALGAAVTARTSTGPERDEALAVLDRSRDFLAARAAGQPGNFRHLFRLVEATRAAVHGDFPGAVAAYDAAMADAATAGRSWHAPLITELAARFYLEHGMEHVGARLLGEALPGYAAWGAAGKVHALKRAHPSLRTVFGQSAGSRTATNNAHSINLSTEVIDLMAVLEAARALSSERDLDQLRIRVQHVLGQMTGATAVHLVTWDEPTGRMMLLGDGGRPAMDVEEAGERALLPLTAIRYAERTRETMLVDDVTLDDRVGKDPYLAGLDHCSLLIVPIGQGQSRAVLVLENRLSRRAFSGRLDAVDMIAGQLTVSLENAQVYASLERKVAERTEELNEAKNRLEVLTVTDPLTGLPNRRKLNAFLDETWQRSQRSGEPVGVAMIDIDNFKKYNDHFGHQGGDVCLRMVADALRTSVRATDLVARYGGEEFCIVMPGANDENALVVAERACESVALMGQPHPLADSGVVTISVGVVSGTPVTNGSPEQLTKLADEALYEAKNAGRNRVVAG
ncbi:diguanylate cyclase [Actinoplanes derwentensis]|uniref:Diguanylate cyclase (GGDEF) domain-containing protein n=1 Tax=Actinoplanes derwentensis TaxID=113562 RepID=A0A1H2A7H2_9ACTN|nr:diguanylate cyclase [Actinoplanes derwentensis]GID88481.1 serine/threonine protein kinase [Actinoplanes derwentensis]SDT41849.1 diguanylate cyclase (GGDEF) domain-containing protein [Actinoplanes derwentensis]